MTTLAFVAMLMSFGKNNVNSVDILGNGAFGTPVWASKELSNSVVSSCGKFMASNGFCGVLLCVKFKLVVLSASGIFGMYCMAVDMLELAFLFVVIRLLKSFSAVFGIVRVSRFGGMSSVRLRSSVTSSGVLKYVIGLTIRIEATAFFSVSMVLTWSLMTFCWFCIEWFCASILSFCVAMI